MFEYYVRALRDNAILDYGWVLSMFAVLEDYAPVKNWDIGIVDGVFAFQLDGEMHSLGIKHVKNTPMLKPNEVLKIPADGLINQPQAIDTTFGIAMANQILLCYPFGNSIPYINRTFSIKDVEKIYVPMMVADKDYKPGSITVSQMKLCKRGCELLGQLTRVLVHSATPKNIVAPTGIDAYKKKVLAQYKKEGKDINDALVMVDFEDKLIKFDENFLKDDPSSGVYVDGKVKYKSRLKVFMSYGIEKGWSSTSDQPSITRSLSEGAISTPEELVILNNTVRTASYSRGTEIILGGVTATLVTRIAAHLSVVMKDCKTKNHLAIRVRPGEQSKYLGRTIIKAGKSVVLTQDNVNSISGETIKLRSVTTCANPVICMICAGKAMSERGDSLGLFAFGVSSKIVKSSLASFHGETISSVEMDLADIT